MFSAVSYLLLVTFIGTVSSQYLYRPTRPYPVNPCRRVYCPAIYCPNGQYTPQGECCPRCRRDQVCTLPAETGPCRAFFPSYFFNAATCRCEEFVWGGCGGNENRFETLEACQARCSRTCY